MAWTKAVKYVKKTKVSSPIISLGMGNNKRVMRNNNLLQIEQQTRDNLDTLRLFNTFTFNYSRKSQSHTNFSI